LRKRNGGEASSDVDPDFAEACSEPPIFLLLFFKPLKEWVVGSVIRAVSAIPQSIRLK
jgi:hypothetical protein